MACPHGVVSGQCNGCLAERLAKEQDLINRIVWRRCSWCVSLNLRTVRWCSTCSHAAQKPRVQCDCPQCQP